MNGVAPDLGQGSWHRPLLAGRAAGRVANRAQDTTGFSVVGPGRFIGSGHPDPREDDVRPPLLGLVESDDAGVTWERVILHGQADFHALAAVDDQVYGHEATSSTFMVSAGQGEWERRSQLPLRGFAVSPNDPDQVVATTSRAWVPLGSVGGEPKALSVDEADGTTLVHVAGRGRGILVSADGGQTFATRYAETRPWWAARLTGP